MASSLLTLTDHWLWAEPTAVFRAALGKGLRDENRDLLPEANKEVRPSLHSPTSGPHDSPSPDFR